MRKLLIDALPLLFSGGISNYVAPLVEALLNAGPPQWRIEHVFRIGPSFRRWKLFQKYHRQHLTDAVAVRRTFLPNRLSTALWERGVPFPVFLTAERESVFIATTELVPKRMKGRVGWIVYDLTPYHLSEIFSINRAAYLDSMARRAGRADFIIAISENTKKDLINLLDYPEDSVCVVYPGMNPRLQPASSGSFESLGKRPYICYLGSLSLSKNVDGMLRIFSRVVHAHHLNLDMILTGKDFCGESFWAGLVQDLKIEGRVHFTGWISDEERNRLLGGARMLWLFSWYEGFGLPVLEAAGKGIPVMHTNRGSVPEILKNAEQAIDPADESDAAARAAAALSSTDTLARWREMGLARAAEFSWEKSASRFLNWLEQKY